MAIPKESTMTLFIKPVDGYEEVVTEYYTFHCTFHEGDAGLDLFCVEDLVVPARAYSVKMPLGVSMEAFYPYVMTFTNTRTHSTRCEPRRKPTAFYLYPRSSTGSKTPIRLSNSVGVIDAGYRGPLMAILDNVSDEPFTMKKGERYFQVCSPDLCPITFELVEELSDTSRGDGGFGSTG